MGGVRSPVPLGPRPGILVVDDEECIRTLLTLLLSQHGFAVWTAASGDEALSLYKRHQADIGLVLLDVQMPAMDGPQTLEALRQLGPSPTVAFLTGHAGKYTPDELLRRGGCQVISKPFGMAEFVHTLHQLVAHRGRRPA